MQTPANKEKDACTKPQPVSSFRLNQKNWAKIINWQLNKPHILGASLNHFWSLSTKTHTRHKSFQNPHHQPVEWRSTYHDPHSSSCDVLVIVHSHIIKRSQHLPLQELQVHVATVLQCGLCSALEKGSSHTLLLQLLCPAWRMKIRQSVHSLRNQQVWLLAPSSKLYFSIFNWWLFVDFKGVSLVNSGPLTETSASWEVRQDSFHGNSWGDIQHSLELPPLWGWKVEAYHLSGSIGNCGLLNHGHGLTGHRHEPLPLGELYTPQRVSNVQQHLVHLVKNNQSMCQTPSKALNVPTACLGDLGTCRPIWSTSSSLYYSNLQKKYGFCEF